MPKHYTSIYQAHNNFTFKICVQLFDTCVNFFDICRNTLLSPSTLSKKVSPKKLNLFNEDWVNQLVVITFVIIS